MAIHKFNLSLCKEQSNGFNGPLKDWIVSLPEKTKSFVIFF